MGRKDSVLQQMQAGLKSNEQKLRTGFIAQEVEKAANEIKYDFDGINKPQSEKDNYSLVYADFVPSLVKAVQELSTQNDSLQTTNSNLQTQVSKQQKQLDALTAIVTAIQQKMEQCSPCAAPLSNSNISNEKIAVIPVTLTTAALEQNVPNPFTNVTTIGYTLPAQYVSARISILDNRGSVLKQVALSGNGKGNLQVDASTLSAGAYQYSLYVNNKLVATKLMMVSK